MSSSSFDRVGCGGGGRMNFIEKHLLRCNNNILSGLSTYKYTLGVITLLTFIGYLSIPSIEKVQDYYARKSEFQSMLLTPAEFQKLKPDIDYIIDVRSPGEFRGGHVPGAVNIEYTKILNNPQILFQDYKITKEDTLFIYCRSGNRASQAVREIVHNWHERDKIFFSDQPYTKL